LGRQISAGSAIFSDVVARALTGADFLFALYL
jgi:hypothetical protein